MLTDTLEVSDNYRYCLYYLTELISVASSVRSVNRPYQLTGHYGSFKIIQPSPGVYKCLPRLANSLIFTGHVNFIQYGVATLLVCPGPLHLDEDQQDHPTHHPYNDWVCERA